MKALKSTEEDLTPEERIQVWIESLIVRADNAIENIVQVSEDLLITAVFTVYDA